MVRKDGNKRPKVHLEIQQHRKNPLGYARRFPIIKNLAIHLKLINQL